MSLELFNQSGPNAVAGQAAAVPPSADLDLTPAAALRIRHAAAWLLVVGIAVALAIVDGRFGWLTHSSSVSPALAHTTLWILLLALACEFMDATIGMGYGTTLVPLLFVLKLPPAVKEAALLSQLLANISVSFFHHQAGNYNFWKDHATRNTGLLMGGVGLVVAVLAETLTIRMPQHYLRPGITIMVIAIGVFMLAAGGLKIRFRMRNVGVLAAVAGFNKAFSGGGYGPLVAGGQVLVGLPVRAAVASTAIAEAIVCTAAVTTYYLHGKVIPMYLLLPMCVGALLSTPLSAITLRRLPARLVKKIMAFAIVAIGLYALYQGKGV
ncbi:MAG: sulfite exporter TauE/SafE family protein [Phycisphaerae bacterium]|nr:sulfite exporter TauE/SafE family protein [Phycisphaerae bacterium]